MFRTFLLGCSAALLLGCPKHVDFGPQGRLSDPGALLASVDAEDAKLRSLEGDGKLHVGSPDGSGDLSLYLALERPARLHIESFDFFNRPVAALTTDGQRFGLYDATQPVYLYGPATATNLKRFLQAAIAPEEIGALLLGSAFRPPDAEAKLAVDDEAGAYLVTLTAATGSKRIWIHPITRRVVRVEAEGYQARFEDFVATARTQFARALTITVPKAGLELKLRYTEVKVNPTLDAALFVPEPPEEVRQVELDADGNPVTPPGS